MVLFLRVWPRGLGTRDDRRHVFFQGCLKSERSAIRMWNLYRCSMQGVPREPRRIPHEGSVAVVEVVQEDLIGLSVHLVAENGEPHGLEVHANLMGSTSSGLALTQAELLHPLEHTHVCLGRQAVLSDASLGSESRSQERALDRAIYGAGLPVGAAVDDGVVGLLGELLEEGLLEEGVRLLVLGQDVDAAGLSIESMGQVDDVVRSRRSRSRPSRR